jgi:hypothetical protein
MTKNELDIKAFNSAINFALDESEDASSAMCFLSMWREGDWEGISKEFPDFDMSATAASQLETTN